MSPPTDERLSRRAALRTGAAALTAGVASLTGCSGLPPLGSRVRYGTVSAPDSRTPTYREWLPAPAAFSAGDDDYNVLAYEPPPDDASAWTRGSVARSLVATQSDYVGVHVDDVDLAIGVNSIFEAGSAAVLAGDIDTAAVEETIGATSYEADGTMNSHDIYSRPDTDRVLAVTSDGLVFGNGENPQDIVTAITAAQRGDGERYHEASTDFAVLSSGAGRRRWTWLMPGSITSPSDDTARVDTVGRSFGFSHDDDGVYSVRTWLFPEGYGPTAGEVKTALEQQPRAQDADAVEVTIEGRTATIEIAQPLAQYREESVWALVVPHVSWRVTYDADAETVRFEHEAGDAIETARLVIHAGSQREVTDFAVGETLDPGEAVTVSTAGVESGAAVRLVYRSPDGNATTRLAYRELP
jgi:hypothetical protein